VLKAKKYAAEAQALYRASSDSLGFIGEGLGHKKRIIVLGE
jgi:hypothetical protein